MNHSYKFLQVVAIVTAHLVGGSRGGALDVRESEDACVAGNQEGTGELGVEAQQAGPRPERHRVQQPRSRPQVKHLQRTVCLRLHVFNLY